MDKKSSFFNRSYAVFSSIQFGKGKAGCGDKRLFNRESPRIFANRIFLAPSCSAPAYRLRRNRTPSGKMLGKNPPAGFSFGVSFVFILIRGAGGRLRRGARRGGNILLLSSKIVSR